MDDEDEFSDLNDDSAQAAGEGASASGEQVHTGGQVTCGARTEEAGARLDKWLSEQIPTLSRTRAKALIEAGAVSFAGQTVLDPRAKVVPGNWLIDVPAPEVAAPRPEAIPLDILFEDADLIVVNKPAGLVVHPTQGSWSGTLVNALLHHCGETLSGIGGVARPGIVHRLDKDTSGVMVVAKSARAHIRLVETFQDHDIERRYLAITRSAPRPYVGTVETRIARSSADRKKMAVVRDPDSEAGKHAITHYKVEETFGQLTGMPAAALVVCQLETGRTHQIRVHMAHAGAPLIGDATYGKFRGLKLEGKSPAHEAAREAARAFPRQALHAAILGFAHPVTGEPLHFETDPPADFISLLAVLRTIPD
jgi:23S rRNA pseudouridine1911/1915/1917 synthase